MISVSVVSEKSSDNLYIKARPYLGNHKPENVPLARRVVVDYLMVISQNDRVIHFSKLSLLTDPYDLCSLIVQIQIRKEIR